MIKWDKVFKNGPSKICGRQLLKNLRRHGLLKQLILCLAAAHTSIFTMSGLFLIKLVLEVFFVSFVSFYQQTFLSAFYLIILHLSIQVSTLEIHVLNHYGAFASAIININSENQLR